MFSSSVSRLFSAAKGTAVVQRMQHKDGRRAHWAHDEKLDMRSWGIKYRTQSKVKLAVSGLLNPREGVIWLFCSSTCASYCCHTSNHKLIGLKMQKKKKRKKVCTSFSARFCTGKTLTVSQNHHLIFSCFSFPLWTFTRSGPINACIYMYMICILLKPDSITVTLLHR